MCQSLGLQPATLDSESPGVGREGVGAILKTDTWNSGDGGCEPIPHWLVVLKMSQPGLTIFIQASKWKQKEGGAEGERRRNPVSWLINHSCHTHAENWASARQCSATLLPSTPARALPEGGDAPGLHIPALEVSNYCIDMFGHIPEQNVHEQNNCCRETISLHQDVDGM